MFSKPFYQINSKEIIDDLQSNTLTGLTSKQILELKTAYGSNELISQKKRPLIYKFFDQVNDFMIYVLFFASIVSFLTHDTAEGFLILAIILMNAFLGLFQESKAEKALESIKAMASPQTKVLRDGIEQLIDVKEVCVGDIIILDAGDYMPADVRIIESY
ncbi:MAG: cation-transporting P-type ATPase, partial [Acholeplasmataceae bacterium]